MRKERPGCYGLFTLVRKAMDDMQQEGRGQGWSKETKNNTVIKEEPGKRKACLAEAHKGAERGQEHCPKRVVYTTRKEGTDVLRTP